MADFRSARDFLLANRADYDTARAGFAWPDAVPFNWALDWFDAELSASPASRDRCALWVHDATTGSDTRLTFFELSRRSSQVANFLRDLGIERGDHVLLLLGNVPALWETMLACIKLGAIVVPATTLLTPDELADRIARGTIRAVVADADQIAKCESTGLADSLLKICTNGGASSGYRSYADADDQPHGFMPDGPTAPDDPLLLYFTSGTTAKPKLVSHSHRSYPIGALSTMYWIGLQPGDIHLNVSSPGWAKHAWSSFFAPWNAGATVLVVNQPAFNGATLLAAIERCGATTLCAPPTVWRHLIQQDLARIKPKLREVLGTGEPLNPEVIEVVRRAWGLTIRDGYGQTETTAMVGNTPGRAPKVGSMGRPLPGYDLRILDVDGNAASEGEICVVLGDRRPAGLMLGYQNAGDGGVGVDGAVYRTGDVAFTDDDGFLTFVGRADDVFKSNDYRISPFELESVLLEHDAVLEAAVVPTPDPLRLSVPKGFVVLTASAKPDRETALSILRHCGERLAAYRRVRQLAFVSELPKTISGKIRRAHLRRLEIERVEGGPSYGITFDEGTFPELATGRRGSLDDR